MHLLGPLLVPAATLLSCIYALVAGAVGWLLHRRPPVGPADDDRQEDQ